MIRKPTLACLFALLSAAALAGEPKAVVVGKAKATPGSDVYLSAGKSVADPGEAIEWQVIAGPLQMEVLDTASIKGGAAVLLDVQPGEYMIAAVAYGTPAKATRPKASVAIHRLTVGDPPAPPPPAPTPPPTPTPDPKPDGDKVTGKVFATLYWDAASDAARSTLARTDPAVKAAAEAQGGVWNTIEASTDAGKTFVKDWKPFWLPPFVVIQRPDGKVLNQIPLPLTPERVADAIKAVRP